MDATQTAKKPKRKQRYILTLAEMQESIMQMQAEQSNAMREQAEAIKRALNLKQDAIILFV